ncbi:MAG: YhgE/Pip domain-containing protein [Clostridia bacterium]|nr:YhgE/Pip domain-containing protein [Clostridia bacterium]
MLKKMLQEKKLFKIIIFAVVLLIPVIYSFFYLKSYWDPYGNLKDIKIAMINLDSGERGKELIKSLKEAETTLGFIETESENALEGLANDEYYAIITIPQDFTKTLESGGEEEKQKTTIVFTPNKRKNYLSYQIINSALKTAEIQLQSKVAAEVADTMANKLKDVPDSLEEINGGVGQIQDGSEKLTDGLNDLSTGVNTLDTKYSEFDSGVNAATDGSKELSDGILQAGDGINALKKGATDLDNGVSQINDALENADTSKITDLTNGISSLNAGVNGTQGLANGLNSYIDGVHTYEDTIEAGANQLEAGLNQYIAGTNQVDQNQDKILQGIVNYYTALVNAGMTPDETLTQLAGGAKQVLNSPARDNLTDAEAQLTAGANRLSSAKQSAGAAQLTAGEKALQGGMTQVAQGVTQLNNSTSQIQTLGNSILTLKSSLSQVQDGTGKLKIGLGALQTGENKLENGARSLSNGLGELSRNSSLIKTAMKQLDDGAKSALDGGKQLTDGIKTLKNSIEEGKNTAKEEIKKLNGIKEFVEDPVEFVEKSFGEVDSYGIAFTPLFLSIGLWVGALMLYVVLYYDQRHRFGILDHESGNKILQNCIYLGIGAVEGILTGLLLKILLGFSVASIGTYLFECILAGMTFTTIMQFLIRNFGDIGKFIALIVLVLQLAASGGTFPVETIDKGFQAFTSWLPMTYTIRIFKDCLIQTDASLIGGNTLVVLLILIGAFIGNMVIEFIKENKKTEVNEK